MERLSIDHSYRYMYKYNEIVLFLYLISSQTKVVDDLGKDNQMIMKLSVQLEKKKAGYSCCTIMGFLLQHLKSTTAPSTGSAEVKLARSIGSDDPGCESLPVALFHLPPVKPVRRLLLAAVLTRFAGRGECFGGSSLPLQHNTRNVEDEETGGG